MTHRLQSVLLRFFAINLASDCLQGGFSRCQSERPVLSFPQKGIQVFPFGSPRSLRTLETIDHPMDIWAIILLFAFMVGIMGWGMNLFVNGILWYCDWREGTEINWGMETFFTLAMPFTWLYTIFLIVVLYIR